MQDTIEDIARRFDLRPHPEGGFYRETWRASLGVHHPRVSTGHDARRCAGTAIYFLLPAGDFSAFHRVVCSDEMWHLYAGDALELHMIHLDGRHEMRLLTTDLQRGEPTSLVQAGCWQAARLAAGGNYAFGGCTVAPGFEFADFEMPEARRLIAQFPQHAELIDALTRPR